MLIAVSAAVAVAAGYIVALHDGVVSDREARYSKNSRRVLDVGLALMILSGIAIVALHFSEAQGSIVYSPVFLFKWLLILALTTIYIVQRGKPYAHFLVEGATAGSWVALFVVHVVAPDFSWAVLFGLYAVIVGVFLGLWSVLIKMNQKPAAKPVVPVQTQMSAAVMQPATPIAQPVIKAVAPAPIVPKAAPAPVAPIVVAAPKPPAPPIVISKPVPPPPAPQAPVEQIKIEPPSPAFDAHDSPWLPAIHVMPKDVEQLQDKSHITPLSALQKTA